MKLAVGIFILTLSVSCLAQSLRPSLNLRATGEPAGAHNPECGNFQTQSAAQVIMQGAAAGLDAYVGLPLASTALEKLSDSERGWVAARLGIHNGMSRCGTVCAVVPASVQPKIRVCMAEATGQALQQGGTTYPASHCSEGEEGYVPYSLAFAPTVARTKVGNTLVCASGKNWSHDRDRVLSLDITW